MENAKTFSYKLLNYIIMTIHRTFLNYREEGPRKEVNTLPSETQPDMTMSLQQLLERHTKGYDVPLFEGTYQDEFDEYIPDPKSVDQTVLLDLAESNSKHIKELQDKAQKAAKSKVVVQSAPSEDENPTTPAAGDSTKSP